MIRYALRCVREHGFEGWFGSSGEYDEQAARGLVECPFCGSREVSKAIMAPAVAGTKRQGEPVAAPAQMRAMFRAAAREVRQKVLTEFEDVGDAFAREARAIHEGKAEERGIHGQATPSEVAALKEEGVMVAPLPPEPLDEDKLN